MNNRCIILKARPVGIPRPEHFELAEQEVAAIEEGQFLVENHILSVDPAQRGYVNDEGNYLPPVAIGEVMRAMAIGQVIDSKHDDYPVGRWLYGWFGWQDYCVAGPSSVLRKVDPNQLSLSAAAGILGINGLTAYMALHDIGKPTAGETVVVTAGAGAVGSIVGQLARAAGCRTVAIVGDDEKGQLCQEMFGYDAFVNYHGDLAQGLKDACPDGVDVFFDNVAGPIADQVIRSMNSNGRVIQCGTVAIASWMPPPEGPRIEREVLTRRLRLGGFVIFDHADRYDEVAGKLAQLVRQGALTYKEDIETGMECAPAALTGLYAGLNSGKKLIRIR